MSLEDSVVSLNATLAQLVERIDALNDLVACALTSPAATGVPRAPTLPPTSAPTLPPTSAPAPTPTSAPAPTPTSAPAPTPTSAAAPTPTSAPALRYDTDIGPRLVKVAQGKGRPALVDLLKGFGVSNGADIPAERFLEVVAKVDALLAAGA